MSESKVNKELLEKEYFHLQSVIQNFDSKSLTIKAWSVSIAGGIAGSSAIVEKSEILLFAALVSLMFWFIDGSWKSFQYANYRRIWDIEKYMRGACDDIDVLQMANSWSSSYHSQQLKRMVKILFWPYVLLPHFAMSVLLGAIYCVNEFLIVQF